MKSSKLGHVKLNLMKTTEDVFEFKRWLGQSRRVLGVDTETGGLVGPHKDPLRLIQFGDLNEGWAIPWHLFAGVAIDTLNQYEEDLVLHNSPYDAKFIIHHSGKDLKRWKWEKTNDTMTMAHIIDPLRPKGLKPLAAKYIGPEAKVGQGDLKDQMQKHGWGWDTIPWDLPEFWIYAALDPVLTAHIYEHLNPKIALQRNAYELEMGAIRVTTNMMLKGMKIDESYCVTKRQQLIDYAHQARNYLQMKYGIESIGSKNQLIAALEKEGISLEKTTPSGAYALDKAVLKSIDHEIAKTVLNIRKAEKMVGPYFDNFLELKDSNNRVHPTIWTCGARTGRMSVTEPALQTLPSGDPTVRNAFIPEEGNKLISCDYSQIESRLMAHFSEDPGLIAAFHSEEDFFCSLASTIFNEQIDKNDKRRKLTKGVVYGKLYGAGVATMAASGGVPITTMEHVVDQFDHNFPGVKQFQKVIEVLAKKREREDGRGWVKTPNGRILPCEKGKGYTLVNFLLQGHAAEILKRKLVELDAAGFGDNMCIPIHDEIIFEFPEEDANVDTMKQIEETMSNLTDYKVPIVAEPELLEGAWGEKYE